MTETTCKRELELEIPAEDVSRATEKIARDIARVARVPGFRPGKAPATIIRRRYAEEIKSEVLQSLVPEFLEKEMTEKKLTPVTRPHLDKVEFNETGPLRVRAVFEVLPEFELGDYKDLEIALPPLEVSELDVTNTLDEMRERNAAFAPVEDRPVADGDYAVVRLVGVPADGSEPIRADNALCHIGGEETIREFDENLRGARPGEQKRFEVTYPADFNDERLAGKTIHYTLDVLGIKVKQLPELNDEFAKDVSSQSQTLEALKAEIRARLEAAREQRQRELLGEGILQALVSRHDFPVPEAMVESQTESRLERMVRQLAMRGVDPRAVNVDWVSLRRRQRERALADVKAEILLDRIAEAEKVEVSEDEVEQQIAAMARGQGESPEALRARLTKQGALDSMKSKLRSDKTLDWLRAHARIRTTPKAESE
jgi:trigger factor